MHGQECTILTTHGYWTCFTFSGTDNVKWKLMSFLVGDQWKKFMNMVILILYSRFTMVNFSKQISYFTIFSRVWYSSQLQCRRCFYYTLEILEYIKWLMHMLFEHWMQQKKNAILFLTSRILTNIKLSACICTFIVNKMFI